MLCSSFIVEKATRSILCKISFLPLVSIDLFLTPFHGASESEQERERESERESETMQHLAPHVKSSLN